MKVGEIWTGPQGEFHVMGHGLEPEAGLALWILIRRHRLNFGNRESSGPILFGEPVQNQAPSDGVIPNKQVEFKLILVLEHCLNSTFEPSDARGHVKSIRQVCKKQHILNNTLLI
jgi:hypothetical protein